MDLLRESEQIHTSALSPLRQYEESIAEHNEAVAVYDQEDLSARLEENTGKQKDPRHRLGEVLSHEEDAENFQALCRGEQLLVSHGAIKKGDTI